MTRLAQQEYAAALRERYRAAGKREKGRLLEECCRMTGCHRKTAIRLLQGSARHRPGRRGRPRHYGPALLPILTHLWERSDRACSKLLAPLVPTLVAALERHGELRLAPEVRAQLLRLSPATLDRLLSPVRHRLLSPASCGHRARPSKGRSPCAPSANGRTSPPARSKAILSCTAARVRRASPSPAWSPWMWQRAGPSWRPSGGSASSAWAAVSIASGSACPSPCRHSTPTTGASSSTGSSSRGVAARASASPGGAAPARTIKPGSSRRTGWPYGANVIKGCDHAQPPYQRPLASRVLTEGQRQTLEREFLAINPATLAPQIDQTLDALWNSETVMRAARRLRVGTRCVEAPAPATVPLYFEASRDSLVPVRL